MIRRAEGHQRNIQQDAPAGKIRDVNVVVGGERGGKRTVAWAHQRAEAKKGFGEMSCGAGLV